MTSISFAQYIHYFAILYTLLLIEKISEMCIIIIVSYAKTKGELKMEKKLSSIPLIPMRGIVALPGEAMTVEVGREISIAAVNEALTKNSGILLVCQRDASRARIDSGSMYDMGTYCSIQGVENAGETGIKHVNVNAVSRVRITDFIDCGTYFAADCTIEEDREIPEEQGRILKNQLQLQVNAFLSVKNHDNAAVDKLRRVAVESYTRYADIVACFFARNYTIKQHVLELTDIFERYEYVCKLVIDEKKLSMLDADIEEYTRKQIDKSQHEYYLREKITAIRHELGDDTDAELEKMKEEAKARDLPDYVRDRLNKEIQRLESLPAGSHEAPTTRGLIECILDLPWNERSEDVIDIKKAREILDRDHYGLEKVKKRIIEYLSVAERTKNLTGQIICLVGAPGVGKTSIVSSIAEAVGRKFVRMSLGGIDDEAEIRGHRRTYIGAMPGRIITAMRQAKTINPVLLFDEIDKLNKNVHGDPAAAMLEVLDSAQNNTFRDHYLEIPYDLSQVMFITTANSLDTIPRPLLDRMEVIEVPGYLQFEKVQIAARHLIPKQYKKHGLTTRELNFPEASIAEIISGYTHESGVRNLERIIAAVCRNASCELAEGKKSLTITHNRIVKYLGAPRYIYDKASEYPQIGVVNGLAWTQVGGETLTVEVQPVPEGSGKMEITGNLGNVMQESAHAAFTYVRAHAGEYGVASDYFKTHDIHIHVPEGAVPKDGPSAGITLTTAIMSAVSDIPVVPLLAMTGEVTLRGNVLRIGGLREKLLAAVRAGIKKAIVPAQNRSDVDEMEGEIKDNIEISFVSTADEVLRQALQNTPENIITQSVNPTACSV